MWINKTESYDGRIGYNLSMDSSRPEIKYTYAITHEEHIAIVNNVDKLLNMQLSINEKVIYYILRDLIVYPSNCVQVNMKIPSIPELEDIIGLKDRTIRKNLKSLEEKNLIKLVQNGHKKAIYFNPLYYASGKDLDIDTLKLFNIVQCDDEKIEQYIKNNDKKD